MILFSGMQFKFFFVMKNILPVIFAVLIAGAGITFAMRNKPVQEKIEKESAVNKTLVAYFSAAGTTKKVSENPAEALNADIYEIKPLKPYTNADLDRTNKNSRSSVEMADHNSRPGMIKDDFSVSKYDTVFLGFPIWWYIAPAIVNTFLEKHDFSNKRIILFAASGGSGFGKTIDNLKPSVSESAQIIQGDILNSNPSVEQLRKLALKF